MNTFTISVKCGNTPGKKPVICTAAGVPADIALQQSSDFLGTAARLLDSYEEDNSARHAATVLIKLADGLIRAIDDGLVRATEEGTNHDHE